VHYPGVGFPGKIFLDYPIPDCRPDPLTKRSTPLLLLPYEPQPYMAIDAVATYYQGNNDGENIQQTDHPTYLFAV
jgi:hypothetical protein